MSANAQQNSIPSLIRSSSVYFDDGNIALVSSEGVVFRVYRGMLAKASPVFADMFTASHAAPEEIFEGCAVVQMAGDNTEALQLLLQSIFDVAVFEKIHPENLTLREGLTGLAIFHKYQVNRCFSLFKYDMEQLCEIDALLWVLNPPPQESAKMPQTMWTLPRSSSDDLAECIRVFRSVDAHHGLFAAYYTMSCFSPEEILRTLRSRGLLDDCTTVLNGREKIRSFWFGRVREVLAQGRETTLGSCTRACLAAQQEVLTQFEKVIPVDDAEADTSATEAAPPPVDLVLALKTLFTPEAQRPLCNRNACRSAFWGQERMLIDELQDELPSYFGLGLEVTRKRTMVPTLLQKFPGF